MKFLGNHMSSTKLFTMTFVKVHFYKNIYTIDKNLLLFARLLYLD